MRHFTVRGTGTRENKVLRLNFVKLVETFNVLLGVRLEGLRYSITSTRCETFIFVLQFSSLMERRTFGCNCGFYNESNRK